MSCTITDVSGVQHRYLANRKRGKTPIPKTTTVSFVTEIDCFGNEFFSKSGETFKGEGWNNVESQSPLMVTEREQIDEHARRRRIARIPVKLVGTAVTMRATA